jgi:predicted phage terminase large subunit-like protein
MDPLIKRPRGGGDTRSRQAISAAAQREEQVVALRLRGAKYAPIARQVGISKQAAQKIFERALRSNVPEDLESYHRRELAEVEFERERIFQIAEAAGKRDPKLELACMRLLHSLHIRTARLLGLDAAKKLDVHKIYNKSDEKASADSLYRQLVWQSMPRDEQEFHFDSLDRARKRLEAQDTLEKSTKEPVKRQIEAGTAHDRDELLPTERDPAINPGSRFDSIREHRFLAPMRGGLPLGREILLVIQSWKIARKENESDIWTCTTWALVSNNARAYMVDWFKQSMEYTEGRRKVEEMSARWKTDAVLIENAGSGAKVICDLQQTTDIPVIPVSLTDSDKDANASAALSALETGLVTLPRYVEWADKYIESLVACQPGQRDSDFDSTSQAWELLQKGLRAAKDHIANQIEKYLCSDPHCVGGLAFKRKKLTAGDKITSAQGNRYCSELCQRYHAVHLDRTS